MFNAVGFFYWFVLVKSYKMTSKLAAALARNSPLRTLDLSCMLQVAFSTQHCKEGCDGTRPPHAWCHLTKRNLTVSRWRRIQALNLHGCALSRPLLYNLSHLDSMERYSRDKNDKVEATNRSRPVLPLMN